MEKETLQEKLSQAISRATVEMKSFSKGGVALMHRLLAGDLTAYRELQYLIGEALDAQGGIVCAPLHYMRYVNPLPRDEGFLSEIRMYIYDLTEPVFSLVTFCGLPRTVLRRYSIRYDTLFTVDYFDLHAPRRFLGDVERLGVYRERAIRAVCKTVRAFLDWLRRLVDSVAAIVRKMPFAQDEPHRLKISSAVRSVVALADRALGIVIIYDSDGGPCLCFRIPKERVKVWQIVSLLVEGCDRHGDVSLPKNYGAQFRSTDTNGNAINDDLASFYRHIWPSPRGRGLYCLKPIEKPALERGV